MRLLKGMTLGAAIAALLSTTALAETTLTIATVNNGDMIRMQGLTDDFTAKNPDIKLNWVTLEENDLRQKVTTDISTKGGQYDVLTIGMYETPIWGAKGWLVELAGLDDPEDILPAVVRRPVGRRQAVRRAVLRRVLLRHVPQGPDGEGRPDDAGRADLGLHPRRRQEDDRPRQWRERHLPARQGRLGREHGVHHRHVELVRRPLVRRELEARRSTRPSGRTRSTPTCRS